jgi:hypothetical protein
MIVKQDHFGIRSVEVMSADFRPDVVRNSDPPFFTHYVVDAFNVSGVPIAISIADDEMLFREFLGEVETATQEMFPGDWIAKRSVLFRSGSLDGGLDLFNLGFVHSSEIDRILFGTGQDNGLNEAGIDWHGFRPE